MIISSHSLSTLDTKSRFPFVSITARSNLFEDLIIFSPAFSAALIAMLSFGCTFKTVLNVEFKFNM